MEYVRPSFAFQSRVSWVTRPPLSITSTWRSISYSSAERIKRKLFTFLTSALVPNCFCPRGLTLTLASQRTFFHVAVAHTGVEQNLFEAGQIFISLIGRSQIRLTHNFNQRRSASV